MDKRYCVWGREKVLQNLKGAWMRQQGCNMQQSELSFQSCPSVSLDDMFLPARFDVASQMKPIGPKLSLNSWKTTPSYVTRPIHLSPLLSLSLLRAASSLSLRHCGTNQPSPRPSENQILNNPKNAGSLLFIQPANDALLSPS